MLWSTFPRRNIGPSPVCLWDLGALAFIGGHPVKYQEAMLITAIVVLTLLAAAFGLLLGFAAERFRVQSDPIVERIDAVLPQTQCGQCGFAGCRPYAEAIARGEADINKCPPGGEAVVLALADLLGRDPQPLEAETKPKEVASIDENNCIGCTLCLQACPVDAILGAAKQMHTVIESECTGCALCVEPCPVDCILMVPECEDIKGWKWPYPVIAAAPAKVTQA